MLEFNVRKQTLSRLDSFQPAEGSVGYLTAKIHFLTDEWKGKDIRIRAKNKNDKIVYEQDVADGTVLIPWEALVNSGSFYVSLFCRNGGVEITTNSVEIPLTETLPGGSETNPPTPTELDKLREEVAELKDTVENIGPVQDGKTPVKGEDYWTDSDKQEIVDEVLSEVPQNDWNQNDPNAPDYVKNRPFYAETETVAEEQTVTTEDDGESIAAKISANGILEVGKTYKVVFDGVEYECVAYHPTTDNDGDRVYVHNEIAIGSGWCLGGVFPGIIDEKPMLPFAFVQWDVGSITLYTMKENTHTVKVTSGGVVIDPAYQEAIKAIVPDGGAAIIDVTELPTENIREDVFYRLLTGTMLLGASPFNAFTCHIVSELPEVGEPALSGDLTDSSSLRYLVYYNVTDNSVSGYVTDDISPAVGVPAGWYPMEALASLLEIQFYGVVTDIKDSYDYEFGLRLLLEYVVYSYKNNWTSQKSVGSSGTGVGAEVFNSSLNTADGEYSHAEGYMTGARGFSSHAEGSETGAFGNNSHAEGCSGTTTYGLASHAEGSFTCAEGDYSHSEGSGTRANGYASHSEGVSSKATGYASHAEGWTTIASGENSHAEGCDTTASGYSQHVQGKYNIDDPDSKYAHIVGNGEFKSTRSNAHTLDWDGNAWYQGNVYVGGTSQDDAVRLATMNDLGGTLELIETIEVTENMKIDRSAEPDGTAYQFKAVCVRVATTATSFTGGYIYPYSGNQKLTPAWLKGLSSATSATSIFMFEPWHGYWTAVSTMWGQTLNIEHNTATHMSFNTEQYPNITRILTQMTVPAGTTIWIWGVRA